MRAHEDGFKLLELVMTTLFIGLLTATMAPALSGYQANKNLQIAAADAVGQSRQTEQYAMSQDQTLKVLYTTDEAWRGWEVCTATAACGFSGSTTDPVMLKTDVTHQISPSLNVWGSCYRGSIGTYGQYIPWSNSPPCGGSPVLEVLCFNTTGSSQAKIGIYVTAATGQITATRGAGVCP